MSVLVYLFWTIRGRPIASEQKRREPIEGRSSKEANMYARASSAPNPKRMRVSLIAASSHAQLKEGTEGRQRFSLRNKPK